MFKLGLFGRILVAAALLSVASLATYHLNIIIVVPLAGVFIVTALTIPNPKNQEETWIRVNEKGKFPQEVSDVAATGKCE
mgnify:CR=1 FL=1